MPAPMCYNHAVGAPARSDALAEAYRSGHNEAVLKTVWVQAHGGSNPSASATAEKCEPMWFAFFIASAEAEHNNEPLRRKLIAYFLHKIMRRRVRRRADAPAKETLSYSRDAFARTTLKEECSLLFALSFFAVLALWRISRNILHKAINACPVLFASAEAEHNNEPLRRKLIAYFLHKIMRRRVRRLAQQDAFARTTLKEECFLLFRTFLFRSPRLMANIPQHSTFCLRRASSSLKNLVRA